VHTTPEWRFAQVAAEFALLPLAVEHPEECRFGVRVIAHDRSGGLALGQVERRQLGSDRPIMPVARLPHAGVLPGLAQPLQPLRLRAAGPAAGWFQFPLDEPVGADEQEVGQAAGVGCGAAAVMKVHGTDAGVELAAQVEDGALELGLGHRG
jgi:hypothetical protein